MRVTECVRLIGSRRCDQPVPVECQETGPWLCDDCQGRVNQEVGGVYTAYVPMVADVLWAMREANLAQDEAVRRLRGIP